MINKLKIITLSGFLSILISIPLVSAATPLTGVAKNDRFGDLEFSNITGLAPEFQATISDSCNAQGCLLKGFLWNERIGWVALDGEFIATWFEGRANDFTTDLYARISAANGALSGYAWSQHAGWIQLNNDARTNTLPYNQNQNNWGVYLDTGATPDPEGYRFRGYAWSQKLGWIKFSKESTGDDINLPDFAVHANWIPDPTPPELNGRDRTWFDVNDRNGILIWNNFFTDPQSGINPISADLRISTDMPAGYCNATPTVIAVPNTTGNGVNLIISNAGNVSTNTGFCRYFISGKIYNNANRPFIIHETIPNPPPQQTTPATFSPRLSFYVRAGNLDPALSALSAYDTNPIADGTESALIKTTLKDIAGNPIVDIVNTGPNAAYPGNPTRTVRVTAGFLNNMKFDTTRLAAPARSPVLARDSLIPPVPPIQLSFDASNPTTFDLRPRSTGIYNLWLSSFAPSQAPNNFAFNGFTVIVHTDNPGGTPNRIQNTYTLTPNASRRIAFLPPVTLSNPDITSGELENRITLGVPARLRYQLNNFSTQAIRNIDIDHLFSLASSGSASAFLETQKIQLVASSEAPVGWADQLLDQTRYELLSENMTDASGNNLSGSNSLFAYAPIESSFVDAYLPSSDINGTQRSYIRQDGTYLIHCNFGIPVPPVLDANGNCSGDRWLIDRSDTSSLFSLNPGSVAHNGQRSPTFSNPEIDFTVEKIIPTSSPISQVSLDIKPYIAYRFANQPSFTIYENPSSLANLSLQDLGVQFTGLGAGRSIFQNNREFNAINEVNTQNLSTAMHRNIALLTKNSTACTLSSSAVTPLTLSGSSLPVNPGTNNCIRVVSEGAPGTNNIKSIVAFYKGTPGQILSLERPNASDLIEVPANTRYTIIVTGGASLYLKNNLTYNANNQSSLGIILLGDDTTGAGADLLIDPNPTNLVGAVYAEGSLMSYIDRPGLAEPYFYGTGNNTQLLANQLLWQGSIVSKNTIGGAPKKIIPSGKSCLATISSLDCAQRYDLNFIRRFSVNTVGAMPDFANKIANNGKFSGNGSCDSNLICRLGALPAILPTLISLSDGDNNGSLEISRNNSKLDPFFIEKDTLRIITNPPPGFSINAEQKFFQEIR